jgi:pimeloyl-ACP methyl ester carboxylesterase
MSTSSSHRHRRIPGFDRSYALLSEDEETDTAVVFIHGFGGHPRGTWLNFQGMIDTAPVNPEFWRKADLFFYRYRSIREHLHVNATAFAGFLAAIYPKPSGEIFSIEEVDAIVDDSHIGARTVRLETKKRYGHLVVVGHSEGGLLTRAAILDTAKNLGADAVADIAASDTPSLLRAKLRLFAPALMGNSLSGFLGMLAHSTLLGNPAAWVLLASRAAADMRSVPNLRTIQEGTQSFAERWPGLSGFRARVLWGTRDSIVTPNEYTVDTRSIAKNKHHTSVCKPTSLYLKPLELVSEP